LRTGTSPSLCNRTKSNRSSVAAMAANFWQSSHYQNWVFFSWEKLQLHKAASAPKTVSFSKMELGSLDRELFDLMERTGKQLLWSLHVVATAKLFYRRFYIKRSVDRYDPRLLAVTVMYLAAKVEELGQYDLRSLLRKWNDLFREKFPKSAQDFHGFSVHLVHDYEFHVLDALEFQLVVFHPFTHLKKFTDDANPSDQKFSQDWYNTAWIITNDAYLSDVLMLYPPYLIALATLYISLVANPSEEQQKQVQSWFNSLNVNLNCIQEIVKQIMNQYEEMQKYDQLSKDEKDSITTSALSKINSAFMSEHSKQGELHRKRAREYEEERRRKKAKVK